MKNIFLRSYPLPENRARQLKTAAVVSLVVFAFLFMMHPFSGSSSVLRSLWGSLLGGVIVFGVVSFYYFILFPLFPGYFKEERWNIGRELVWTLWTIIMIALANALTVWLMGVRMAFSPAYLARMVGYTAIVGVAPVTVSIILNQARLLRLYRKAAVQLNNGIQTPGKPAVPVNDAVLLVADNGKDVLELSGDSVLAITSADNYIKIYVLENGQVKMLMLRSSLQKAGASLMEQSYFWRCHRTAIINLRHVQTVSGTAQGYRLHVEGMAEPVPVSRSLNSQLRERLAHRM